MSLSRTTIMSAIVLCLFSIPKSAFAEDWDAFRDTLQGNWRGEGLVREGPEGTMEAGVCRVDVSNANGSEALIFKGRCANANRSARFRTEFNQTDGAGAVKAISETRMFPDGVTLVGQRSERSIALSSAEPVSHKERPWIVGIAVRFQPDGDGFSLVQTIRDPSGGSEKPMLEMNFQRRPAR
ncbi:MAG: hypothetical protein AAGF59_06555 [Pseudomonadota bacterium]